MALASQPQQKQMTFLDLLNALGKGISGYATSPQMPIAAGSTAIGAGLGTLALPGIGTAAGGALGGLAGSFINDALPENVSGSNIWTNGFLGNENPSNYAYNPDFQVGNFKIPQGVRALDTISGGFYSPVAKAVTATRPSLSPVFGLADDSGKYLDELFGGGQIDDTLQGIQNIGQAPKFDMNKIMQATQQGVKQGADALGGFVHNVQSQTSRLFPKQPVQGSSFPQYHIDKGLGAYLDDKQLAEIASKQFGLKNIRPEGKELELAFRNKVLPDLQKQTIQVPHPGGSGTIDVPIVQDIFENPRSVSAKYIQDRLESLGNIQGQLVDPLAEKLGLPGSGKLYSSPSEFFTDAAQRMEILKGATKKGFNSAYDSVMNPLRGQSLTSQELAGTSYAKSIDDASGRIGAAEKLLGEQPYKDVTPMVNAGKKILSGSDNVFFEDIRGLRTAIGDKLRSLGQNIDDTQRGIFQNVKSGATDLQKTLANKVDPTGKLSGRLSKVDELYGKNYASVFKPKTGKNKAGSEIATALQNPEKLNDINKTLSLLNSEEKVAKFQKATRLSDEELANHVESLLFKTQEKALGDAVRDPRMVEGGQVYTHKIDPSVDVFSTAKINSILNKKGSAVKYIFKDPARRENVLNRLRSAQQLEELQKLSQSMRGGFDPQGGTFKLNTANLDDIVGESKFLQESLPPEAKKILRVLHQLNYPLEQQRSILQQLLHAGKKGVKIAQNPTGAAIDIITGDAQ